LHAGEAGERHEQGLVVSAHRHRQVPQLVASDIAGDSGSICLKRGGGGSDRHRFRDRADGQRDIETRGIVGRNNDTLLSGRREAFFAKVRSYVPGGTVAKS
jgi:hypothetical protein